MEVKCILELIIVPLKAGKSNIHSLLLLLLFSMRTNRSQDIQRHVFFPLNYKCHLAILCTYIVCFNYSDPPQPVNLSFLSIPHLHLYLFVL